MKILVVDDEPLARERLLRILGSLQPGAECKEAASGQEALQLVESINPDLVLLDIRMPGMDGIEVATHLDTLENPPAIVFCTAFDEYALQALQHQAVAYLLKPVREAELARALGAAPVSGRGSWNPRVLMSAARPTGAWKPCRSKMYAVSWRSRNTWSPAPQTGNCCCRNR